MKNISLTLSFIFFVFLMYGATFSQAENTFAVKILEYFPQADTNKDGVLSEDEEAAVRMGVVMGRGGLRGVGLAS